MPTLKKTKRHRKKERSKRKTIRSEILLTLLVSAFLVMIIIFLTSVFLPNTTYNAIVRDAASWMINRQEEGGHFKYEYDPWENTESDDDNLVRQAGAAYIMAELFNIKGDGSYLKSTMNALDYLDTLTKFDTRDDKELAYIEDHRGAKAGIQAFAVIACERVRNTWFWNSEIEERCEGYENTLLFLAKENGGFSKYYYEDLPSDAVEFDVTSPYYDGEAWLALAILNQRKQSPYIAALLENQFKHFNAQYRTLIDSAKQGDKDARSDVVGFYLWGMRALDTMHQEKQDKRYEDFAYYYTHYLMDSKGIDDLDSDRRAKINDCYLFEGVISTYGIAKRSGNEKMMTKLEPIIKKHLGRLATMQVKKDMTREIILNGRIRHESLIDPTKARGGFLNSLKEDSQQMRIDYTQHCIGAYLLAEEYLN